jgi:2-polyprenyl-3-methyl-5-hydroxy-6-metoxy-1,4-benzoquinol methylase
MMSSIVQGNDLVNKTSYDLIAKEWKTERDQSFVSALIVDWECRLPRYAQILDVGCGTGYPIAHYLVEKGHRVTGIDSSANMIAESVALSLSKASFIHIDFFDYDPDVKFDGIICWDSLFHMPRDKQPLIYQKLSSCLADQGLLLFTHGDQSGEHMGTMMGQSFYYSALDLETLTVVLEGNDLQIIKIHQNYIEKNTDRDLVVLAQKVSNNNSKSY